MSPFEPLQFDSRRIMNNAIVDSRLIALIASKKNFDVEKERKLIEKARHYSSVCKCRHFTGTEPCYYRNCRHFPEVHYKRGVVSSE